MPPAAYPPPVPPAGGPPPFPYGPGGSGHAPWPAYPPALQIQPPQRPAVLTMAATLAVTASLQWICGLSFFWLVATAGARDLDTSGSEGSLFHMLNRFHYRMLDGLAWPLYLLPTAAFVLSFCILVRREWTRIAFSATGVLALAWSAWLLRDHLGWWLVPAFYIAVTSAIVWTRAATAWYRWSPRAAGGAEPRPTAGRA